MEESKEYVDPEPWMHRWPNADDEGVRSAEETCSVKDCVSTFEPRTGRELKRILEIRSAPHHWWSTLVSWIKGLWSNLTR